MVSNILVLDIVKNQVLDIVTMKMEVLDIVKNQVLDIVTMKMARNAGPGLHIGGKECGIWISYGDR